MKNLIGIDIGGTKCAVILGKLDDNGDINILGKETCLTADYPSPAEMIPYFERTINKILKDHKLRTSDIGSLGISCGGPQY